MSVRTEHDESTNTYNLVADIDGAGIVFASVPGDTVTARIAAVEAEAFAQETTTTRGGGAKVSQGAGAIDPSDYADNADGTYTRQSDGQVGRFTPSGFEPTTSG